MKNNLQNTSGLEEKKIDWKTIQNVMKEKFTKENATTTIPKYMEGSCQNLPTDTATTLPPSSRANCT